jgi:uncharacterized protein
MHDRARFRAVAREPHITKKATLSDCGVGNDPVSSTPPSRSPSRNDGSRMNDDARRYGFDEETARCSMEEDVGFARIDHGRAARTGAGETVYAAGKTPEQTESILRALLARAPAALATRVPPETAERLLAAWPDGAWSPAARLFVAGRPPAPEPADGHALVICAGTADLPVAEEAQGALRFFGFEARLLADVGVAGLHRLLSRTEALRAKRFGWRHQFLHVDPLALPGLDRNPPDRCYWCKRNLFQRLDEIARAEGHGVLVDGSNTDDALEHRPGRRALAELGVRSPLAEAGLDKAAVRTLAKRLDLPWDLPAEACLATRFPHDTPLTPEGLARVGRAEDALRALGVRGPFRVRVHGDLARLEAPPEEMPRLAGELRLPAAEALRDAGFKVITLDLRGYIGYAPTL